MTTIPFHTTTGTWVRFVRGDTTLGLDRWPGPHRPGEVIHASGGSGCFSFDRFDIDADGGPEAVYRWTSNA